MPVIARTRDIGDLGRRWQIGFLSARQRQQFRSWLALDQTIFAHQCDRRFGSALAEYDAARTLQTVKEVGEFEWLQRIARRHDAIDDVTRDDTIEAARVMIGEAMILQNGFDSFGQGRTGKAAVEPMAQPPIVAIAPDVNVVGECWERPRIPAINMNARQIDHALAGHRRDRI